MQSDISFIQCKLIRKLVIIFGLSLALSACGSGNVHTSYEDAALKVASSIDEGANTSAEGEEKVAKLLIKSGF